MRLRALESLLVIVGLCLIAPACLAGVPCAGTSQVSVATSYAATGDSIEIEVIARDCYGYPVGNWPCNFFTDRGDTDTVIGNPAITDWDGRAQAKVTTDTPGDSWVYANLSGVIAGPAPDPITWSVPGLIWTQMNDDGFGDPNNAGATPTVVFKDMLYAGTTNFVTGAEVWRSSDGSTWNQVNSDGFGDPTNAGACTKIIFQNELYAGTWKLVGGGEIWRTSDGLVWTQVNADGFGDPNNLWAYPSAIFNGYLYAGTENYVTGGEVWRTSDGVAWTQVNTDGFGDPNNAWAHGLLVFQDTIYAATRNDTAGAQVWRSADGTNWTQANVNGFGDANNVGIHPIWAADDWLYAGTDNYVTGTEVLRYRGGTNWTQVNADGFGDPNNFALAGSGKPTGCDCGCNNTVGTWNTTTGAEVWRLSGGTIWTQLNTDGFGDPNNYVAFVSGVCFDGKMHVGTANDITGGEIWRGDILAGVDGSINPVSGFPSLAQNHPNPFSAITTIRYYLPTIQTVTLRVYNTLGQEVATLVNERQAAGSHSVEFNASELSSSVYFYMISVGNLSRVRKMVFMK